MQITSSNIILTVKGAKLRKLYNKLKNLLNNEHLSFVIRILGVSIFFILFEFAFFSLLFRFGHIFYELWLLEIIIVSGYCFFLYSTYYSKRSKILKIFKVILAIAMLSIFILILFVVCFLLTNLITIKIILGLFISYYVVNLIFTIKLNYSKNRVKSKHNYMSLTILFMLLTPSVAISSFALFIPNTIEIQPKTHPEIIFWCGSNQLPNETSEIEISRTYNIGFMPTIRRHNIGNEEYMSVYKNLIKNGINLYFAIGGDSGFFANIDNAKEFPGIYNETRQWFIDEGIFYNPHIVAFAIDAEPPKDYEKYREDSDNTIETINYGVKNYPSESEIDEATEALIDFTEAVKKDNKQVGIIRAAELLDSSDSDDDLSLFLRNVYTLDIEWDFSITMLYRTNSLQSDESDASPSEFTISMMNTFWGSVIEGTKFTNSELNFYQNVELSLKSSETKADNYFVFIGVVNKEFEETSYIKKEWYKKDIDILRHFKAEKVFLYELKGFLRVYGWEGIKELGLHVREKESWTFKYNNYKSIIFLFFYCMLIIADLFVFFERDLT